MLGYFDDQIATEQSFNASGWFMTGDLGWMDETGFLRIVGRKKDISWGAATTSIQPASGSLRRDIPPSTRSQRFRSPTNAGERVCLAVVTRMGHDVRPEQLLLHLADAGLSRYDMPEYMLFLDKLPLTASGKITKREWSRRLRKVVTRLLPCATSGVSA